MRPRCGGTEHHAHEWERAKRKRNDPIQTKNYTTCKILHRVGAVLHLMQVIFFFFYNGIFLPRIKLFLILQYNYKKERRCMMEQIYLIMILFIILFRVTE